MLATPARLAKNAMHEHQTCSEKIFLTADALYEDSCRLALEVLRSGYRPTYVIALWRGGTPVGACVHETLSYFRLDPDHIAVRTSLYTGIGSKAEHVEVRGLDQAAKRITEDDRLLIVDDVFDTGQSIDVTIDQIRKRGETRAPRDIRVAVAWYKPESNKTERTPDYFVNTTDKWVVFPHELVGLSRAEIDRYRPSASRLLKAFESDCPQ